MSVHVLCGPTTGQPFPRPAFLNGAEGRKQRPKGAEGQPRGWEGRKESKVGGGDVPPEDQSAPAPLCIGVWVLRGQGSGCGAPPPAPGLPDLRGAQARRTRSSDSSSFFGAEGACARNRHRPPPHTHTFSRVDGQGQPRAGRVSLRSLPPPGGERGAPQPRPRGLSCRRNGGVKQPSPGVLGKSPPLGRGRTHRRPPPLQDTSPAGRGGEAAATAGKETTPERLTSEQDRGEAGRLAEGRAIPAHVGEGLLAEALRLHGRLHGAGHGLEVPPAQLRQGLRGRPLQEPAVLRLVPGQAPAARRQHPAAGKRRVRARARSLPAPPPFPGPRGPAFLAPRGRGWRCSRAGAKLRLSPALRRRLAWATHSHWMAPQ